MVAWASMATMRVSSPDIIYTLISIVLSFFFKDAYYETSYAMLTSIAADVEANEIFGDNVKKLEELKHKYDPDNLFSHGTRLTPRPLVVVN
jgi:hypothetical protein